MTAHNGPRLSKRMKEQLNQQDTPQVAAKHESAVSATEGQETASNEPLEGVFEPQKQAESGSNLEAETVQILDSEGEVSCSTKAENEEILEPQVKTSKDFVKEALDLAATLRESEQHKPLSFTLENVSSQELEESLARMGHGKIEYVEPKLGPQPDGTLSVLVKIAEEYIAGVEEAARTDGRTVDQWCTERFQEYLDAYYTPIKGR